MAIIPWTTPKTPSQAGPGPVTDAAEGAAAEGSGPVVMASRFRLRSRRDTVAMLRHALRVRRVMLTAPGALGVSLAAHPLRGEYWTLSGWSSRAALDAFVGTPEHRAAMRRLGPASAEALFSFWSHDAAATPPTWSEARARVIAQQPKAANAPEPA
ncbi:MAG: antibiotic biosynthesis monooxygenase [Frankia sp.]|nr:antibiotic biosynthesis monooxygenase [Frankia sp.]